MLMSSAATTDTREKLLDAADEFLRARSFAGFSFQDLARSVGIKKGSVYHHFETKEALVVAVLERARQQLEGFLAGLGGQAPEYVAEACLALFRDRMGAGRFVCPGGSLSCQWDYLSEPVRAAGQRLMAVHLRLLETLAQAMAWEDPPQKARWLLSMFQGALLVDRSNGNDLAMQSTVAEVRRLMALPAPPAV